MTVKHGDKGEERIDLGGRRAVDASWRCEGDQVFVDVGGTPIGIVHLSTPGHVAVMHLESKGTDPDADAIVRALAKRLRVG